MTPGIQRQHLLPRELPPRRWWDHDLSLLSLSYYYAVKRETKNKKKKKIVSVTRRRKSDGKTRETAVTARLATVTEYEILSPRRLMTDVKFYEGSVYAVYLCPCGYPRARQVWCAAKIQYPPYGSREHAMLCRAAAVSCFRFWFRVRMTISQLSNRSIRTPKTRFCSLCNVMPAQVHVEQKNVRFDIISQPFRVRVMKYVPIIANLPVSSKRSGYLA